jgi:hypothetical protein
MHENQMNYLKNVIGEQMNEIAELKNENDSLMD